SRRRRWSSSLLEGDIRWEGVVTRVGSAPGWPGHHQPVWISAQADRGVDELVGHQVFGRDVLGDVDPQASHDRPYLVERVRDPVGVEVAQGVVVAVADDA